MGMVTPASRVATTSSGRPPASLPSTRATGPVQSNVDVVGAAPDHRWRPVANPARDRSGHHLGGRPHPRPPGRGTASRPWPARTSDWSGSTVPSQQMTASTPAASAVRISVPRLPGSRTSTHTTTRVAPSRESRGVGRVGHHGQQRLGGHRRGDPLHHAGGEVEDPSPLAEDPVGHVDHGRGRRPLGSHVDRLDRTLRRPWPPTAVPHPRPPPPARWPAGRACAGVGAAAAPVGG